MFLFTILHLNFLPFFSSTRACADVFPRFWFMDCKSNIFINLVGGFYMSAMFKHSLICFTVEVQYQGLTKWMYFQSLDTSYSRQPCSLSLLLPLLLIASQTLFIIIAFNSRICVGNAPNPISL